MANKQIGIYGTLESTANYKVEDLYIIINSNSIQFSVKNINSNEYLSFESFENDGSNNWSALLSYLQNNSSLIHGIYNQVHFVMNHSSFLLAKFVKEKSKETYLQEFEFLYGYLHDSEIMVHAIGTDKTIVYAVPDSLMTLLTRAFPTGNWSHYAAYLLQDNLANGLYLTIFESHFLIMLIKDAQVQILRYFNQADLAENLYQVLSLCTNFEFQANQETIFIKGYVESKHQWVEQLVRHFAQVELQENNNASMMKALQHAAPNFNYATYLIF